VLLADVRATDGAPESVLPRREPSTRRVQNPPAIPRGDRQETGDGPEVPAVLVPSVGEELGIEADEDGVVPALDRHELAHAHAEEDAIGGEELELARRKHLIEDASREITA